MKKKICWITPDCFVDCDNNPEILKNILKYYNIHWIVLLHKSNSRFKESDFENLKQIKGLSIDFVYRNCRARDPRMMFFYEKIFSNIRKQKADIIYFNYVPTSPYILPIYWRLNKKTTIFTAHDGSVKPTFPIPWLNEICFKYAFGSIKQVNMFSPTQAALFNQSFPDVKQFIIPLALKDFGESNLPKRTDSVVFFFFGAIHPGKNVGLLIDAACSLYEEGMKGFKVSINGVCTDWSIYERKIKYPELFELDIRSIENEEIPDLFAKNHYMVFPYKEMSQSGALKVAFNYNVPVIVSDLQGFTDEVREDTNGYVFESENVDSLKNIMKSCIVKHNSTYNKICNSMSAYIEKNYSQKAISAQYIDMFNTICN